MFAVVIKKPEQTITMASFAKIATKRMMQTGLNAQSVSFCFTKNFFIVNYCFIIRDISKFAATSKIELFVTILISFQLLTDVISKSTLNILGVLDTPQNSNTFFLLLFKIFKISLLHSVLSVSDGITMLQHPRETQNSNYPV